MTGGHIGWIFSGQFISFTEKKNWRKQNDVLQPPLSLDNVLGDAFLYVLFPRNNRRLIVGIRLTIQQVHICDKALGLHVSKEVRHCV